MREHSLCEGLVLTHGGYYDGSTHPVPVSTEVHHVKGRGKYLLDTSTWMAVSSEAHRAIHAFPKISYAKGYMQPKR